VTWALLGCSSVTGGNSNDSGTSSELDVLHTALQEAIRAGTLPWVKSPPFLEYAATCSSALHRLEYRFVTETMDMLETDVNRPLRILHVSCGVAPLGNWLSRRGHQVVAVDPSSSTIELLVSNDLNGFYESRVHYQMARCEALPFDPASFDLVLAISALDRLPPGSDRVALWELGRVLKPGGHLVTTSAVLESGEDTTDVRAEPRPGERAFTMASMRRLLGRAVPFFAVQPDDLPRDLRSFSRDDVRSFRASSPSWQGHGAPAPDRLIVGGVIRRTDAPMDAPATEIIAALLEGQAALELNVALIDVDAQQNRLLSEDLADQLADLIAELQRLTTRTQEADGLAATRLEIINRQDNLVDTFRAAAAERLDTIRTLQTIADERLDTIRTLQTVAEERLSLIQALQAVAEERLSLIQALESAAEERLQIIQEQGRKEAQEQAEGRTLAILRRLEAAIRRHSGS
jgi:ubiquinone/menaquinone biosynthesis C-methylase UbiE